MNYLKEFQIDLNSAKSIRNFNKKLRLNTHRFSGYDSANYGLDWLSTKFAEWMYPFYSVFNRRGYQQGLLCLDSYYEADDPRLNECAGNSI